jgi:serine/threonine protein kinase
MSVAEVRMFLSEALCMAKFHHQHVLHLVGVSFDDRCLPLVVLPFMKHGDLLSYIRNERNVSVSAVLMRTFSGCSYVNIVMSSYL